MPSVAQLVKIAFPGKDAVGLMYPDGDVLFVRGKTLKIAAKSLLIGLVDNANSHVAVDVFFLFLNGVKKGGTAEC